MRGVGKGQKKYASTADFFDVKSAFDNIAHGAMHDDMYSIGISGGPLT